MTIHLNQPIEVTAAQYARIGEKLSWACPRRTADGKFYIKLWFRSEEEKLREILSK